MKNMRNICLVMVIPFAASALAFAASSLVIREVERDITDIEWNYRAMEGYSIKAGKQPLIAEQVYDKNYPLSAGNDLVWSVTSAPDSAAQVASVEETADGWFFVPENPGQAIVTCSNQKGNVNRSFTAQVFKTGAIIVNPDVPVSGHSISDEERFGLYDFETSNDGTVTKKKTGLTLDLDVVGDNSGVKNLEVTGKSDNIESAVLTDTGIDLEFSGAGESYISLEDTVLGSENVTPQTYRFEVVDGVNVYSYDDLLNATNRSQTGENIVLRTNFGSLNDIYEIDPETGRPLKEDGKAVLSNTPRSNTVLFGHYDEETDTFDFEKEIYSFKSDLNSPFIEKWNEYIDSSSTAANNFDKYDDTILSGIHLKGDLYGNGFSLNLHNLCYPYETQIRTDENGSNKVPALRDDNLFRGPKTFYAFGDPNINNNPIVAVQGQDNSGIYIDTDGITISDAEIFNCEMGDNFENLRYTGTVVDIKASDVTIEDSVIGNGRTAIRAFSAPNLTLDNCLVENGYTYLLDIGSNNLKLPDSAKNSSKINYTVQGTAGELLGSKKNISSSLSAVFGSNNAGDIILNSYLLTDADLKSILHPTVVDTLNKTGLIGTTYDIPDSEYPSLLKDLQGFIDYSEAFKNSDGTYDYDSTVTVKDTIFYRSGITSINMDNTVGGPFLYNRSPLAFYNLMNILNQLNKPGLVPVMPNRINATMQPSSLNITGETRFYDWKSTDDFHFAPLYSIDYGILTSKIPSLADCTLDDFYPIKGTIENQIEKTGDYIEQDSKKYINIPVLLTGGNFNRSSVTFDAESLEGLNNLTEADVVNTILTRDFKSMWPSETAYNTMNLIAHAVSSINGFAPYSYSAAAADYSVGIDDVPNIAILQNRN